MHIFTRFLEGLVLVLNIASVAILLLGLIVATVHLIRTWPKKEKPKDITYIIHDYKKKLGSFILLGLEILIVADIIETIGNRSTNSLISLSIIVLVRTLMAFFLDKELSHS